MSPFLRAIVIALSVIAAGVVLGLSCVAGAFVLPYLL